MSESWGKAVFKKCCMAKCPCEQGATILETPSSRTVFSVVLGAKDRDYTCSKSSREGPSCQPLPSSREIITSPNPSPNVLLFLRT